ncbi:MAG: outer membrane lipoprotein carrier protein LolA [Bacteroidales bacterium]|nr:outer membrane lipoprotein carrier protein LolA [Bacteroidales bacterium]
MKRIILLSIVLSFVASLSAQQWKTMADVEARAAATMLLDEVKKVKKLDRKFEQVKQSPMTTTPAVSKGTMHYESPDALTWSYETPFAFSMEIRGEKMTARRDGQVVPLGSRQQMGMKSMMKMIVGMSSGSSLFDDKTFDWTMAEGVGGYKVEMTPKNKNMRRMFTKVVLFFDKATKLVTGIELTESDSSLTTITFK